MPVLSDTRSAQASRINVRTIACTGMLCAIAYVVMFLSKTIFAPLAVAGFLTFDLKDVVIAIGGFIFGPLNALAISLVVSLIEMVTVSGTGPVGLLMNVLATISFVCPAAFLYKRRHQVSSAVFGLVLGGLLISEAHVPRNDEDTFDSADCGRGNSARLFLRRAFPRAAALLKRCNQPEVPLSFNRGTFWNGCLTSRME